MPGSSVAHRTHACEDCSWRYRRYWDERTERVLDLVSGALHGVGQGLHDPAGEVYQTNSHTKGPMLSLTAGTRSPDEF